MNNQSDLFHIYTIHNPDNQPFDIYHNGELFRTIQPGMAVQVVKMVGERAVQHLVSRMVRKHHGPAAKNDPDLRAKWTSKILIGNTASPMPVQPTVMDQARMLTEQLAQQPVSVPDLPLAPATPIPQPETNTDSNPDWKFDPITGERIEKKTVDPDSIDVSNVPLQTDGAGVMPGMPAGTGPHHSDPETDAILKGMSSGGEGRELKVDGGDDETPYIPPAKTKPTREQLFAFMENDLKIDVNEPKTRTELDSKSDDELIEMTHYYEIAE